MTEKTAEVAAVDPEDEGRIIFVKRYYFSSAKIIVERKQKGKNK